MCVTLEKCRAARSILSNASKCRIVIFKDTVLQCYFYIIVSVNYVRMCLRSHHAMHASVN